MITIKNLHKEKPSKPYDIKVDRSSILGNPYYMEYEHQRKDVCNKYYSWFYNKKHTENFYKELKRLKEIYLMFEKLNLFCWCAPKQCHAETIKEYLKKDRV